MLERQFHIWSYLFKKLSRSASNIDSIWFLTASLSICLLAFGQLLLGQTPFGINNGGLCFVQNILIL